ncbi:MAG: ABC transporter permease subunit, partial [Symbiobacteriaceae bacterium]|nr:ABC transporter permease subunit [Symbiobacteriaceae bacterium]
MALLCLWSYIAWRGIIPGYLLPAPWQVGRAFLSDLVLLRHHLLVSLQEAALGLLLSVGAALVLAVLMDKYRLWEEMLMPLLVLSQTIPVIALAPLLVLWFGYDLTPKIILIFLVCFFPLAVGLLTAFQQVDQDIIRLMTSMGANYWQSLWHVKIPSSLPAF